MAGVRDYAVVLLDREGNVATWNAGAERIKGYTAEEIVGQHFSRFYPDDAVASGLPAHEFSLASATGRFEDEGWRVRKDGTQFWANVVITALPGDSGEVRGFLKMTRDLTGRKQAGENLRQSEGRFRLLVEGVRDYARFMQHLPGLAWIKDLQGRYVYANDAAMKVFRRTPDGLYGKTDDEVFPPETAAQFKRNDRKVLASEAGVQVIETLEHDDGIVHHSIVSKFPILGPDGNPALVGGMAIDITDRLRAEEVLAESERRFRQLAENINEVFWMADPQITEILYISPAYEQVWGRSCQKPLRAAPVFPRRHTPR